jgi:hypothetical protein
MRDYLSAERRSVDKLAAVAVQLRDVLNVPLHLLHRID